VAAGIRRLEINPFDQDALDTLTYEMSQVTVPEPGTLALFTAFILAPGIRRRMRA
jgi:hypothetical protein